MPSTKRGRIPLAEPRRDAILDATVQQFMRDAAGDPRLTWWEENFLASMAAWVAPDGPGAHRLTTKQWTIIAQITAKIEAPLVDDSDDPPEVIETAPEDSQIAEDIELPQASPRPAKGHTDSGEPQLDFGHFLENLNDISGFAAELLH